MKIGSLYSYPINRQVFVGVDNSERIDTIKQNEPFVFLEVHELKWADAYKVLTINGIVGWIHIGYPERVKEVVP